MKEKTMHDIANEAVDEFAAKHIMEKQTERIKFLDSQIEQLKKELADYKDPIFEYAHKEVSGEYVGFHIAKALVLEHKQLKAENAMYKKDLKLVTEYRDQLQSDRQTLLEALERVRHHVVGFKANGEILTEIDEALAKVKR